ncbi:phosphotransferase family protein [Paenibacillus agri]|uniref:Aminoglycoside phosphotransferase family protein n=1 Tax=Paenibacillus agri TaxID=2744309 RepID=A0A850EKW2_9BACL|nr:aminoglycoside phosphotransferase family protein [Paenibacillus agri]NUU61036.1 aminoglycoside phosphotransferase family protein [Paenibacillus agri]
MGSLITAVNWIEKEDTLDALLNQVETLSKQPLKQGFEAEVLRIHIDQEDFVLKIWSKESKPDVGAQYHLLKILHERGIAVSRPIGWGIDSAGDQVLLTTFDGTPIEKVNDKTTTEVAGLLARLHEVDVSELGEAAGLIPKYDFLNYFFPGASEFSDLYDAAVSLIPLTHMKQDRIIHGDFHSNNILEDNGRYTIIDWTNGQLGDPRYDFAWTYILQKIYWSQSRAEVFRSVYLSDKDIPEEELDAFEALACLRWILLSRRNGVPKRSGTAGRVMKLINNNPFLKERKFSDFST